MRRTLLSIATDQGKITQAQNLLPVKIFTEHTTERSWAASHTQGSATLFIQGHILDSFLSTGETQGTRAVASQIITLHDFHFKSKFTLSEHRTAVHVTLGDARNFTGYIQRSGHLDRNA